MIGGELKIGLNLQYNSLYVLSSLHLLLRETRFRLLMSQHLPGRDLLPQMQEQSRSGVELHQIQVCTIQMFSDAAYLYMYSLM